MHATWAIPCKEMLYFSARVCVQSGLYYIGLAVALGRGSLLLAGISLAVGLSLVCHALHSARKLIRANPLATVRECMKMTVRRDLSTPLDREHAYEETVEALESLLDSRVTVLDRKRGVVQAKCRFSWSSPGECVRAQISPVSQGGSRIKLVGRPASFLAIAAGAKNLENMLWVEDWLGRFADARSAGSR